MSIARISARWLQGTGLPRDQVRALQQASLAVTVSVPQTYTWISNDAGATWGTTTPQTQTMLWYRGGLQIASVTISGARNNGTGFITLTVTAQSGEPVTVTLNGSGTSQLVSAVGVHDLSQAQTYCTFQSLTDTTALGGSSGGGGPGK